MAEEEQDTMAAKHMEDEAQEMSNKMEQLSNEDEALDPYQIEPDYVVDWPPTPEFIPNEKGVDKEIDVQDFELFDFEVEPILQVLVGKCCETAWIEVIEEWEWAELAEHKWKFL